MNNKSNSQNFKNRPSSVSRTVESSIFTTETKNLLVDQNNVKKKNRAQTALAKYRTNKIDLATPSFCVFGKDAPKIAIGISRPETKPPANYPGPGTYDLPTFLDTSQLGIKISRYDKYYEPESVTINIDYTNPRVFPELKQKSISSSERQPFFDMPQSPGPNFLPPSTLSKKTHTIRSRLPIQKTTPEETPGPGTYEPKIISFENAPIYSLSGPTNRDEWMCNFSKTPGPGCYENNKLKHVKSVPTWTFGEKSRKKNIKAANQIVIHPYIIRIDSNMSISWAMKYLEHRPEVREFINEIHKNIMRDKPSDPLMYIAEMYREEKMEYDLKYPKPKREDSIDILHVL